MFICRACLHSIHDATPEVLNTKFLLRSFTSATSSKRRTVWPRRGYATEAIPFENSSRHAIPPTTVKRTHLSPAKPSSDTEVAGSLSKASLEQEIRWLKDPLKLGDYTVKLLRQDDVGKALGLVRLASKDIACTVSWNHLIDYFMSKGKVADATKLYNEVRTHRLTEHG